MIVKIRVGRVGTPILSLALPRFLVKGERGDGSIF